MTIWCSTHHKTGLYPTQKIHSFPFAGTAVVSSAAPTSGAVSYTGQQSIRSLLQSLCSKNCYKDSHIHNFSDVEYTAVWLGYQTFPGPASTAQGGRTAATPAREI